MADLDVTIGLDYGAFKRGLREVESSSARSSEVITRAFRLDVLRRGVQQAFSYAGAAVKEYAKDNAEAQRVVRQWEETGNIIKRGIGSDLVGAMDAFNGKLRETVEWFERMRRGAVNITAGAFGSIAGGFVDTPGESPEDVDAARKQRDELEARIRRSEQHRDFQRRFVDDLMPDNLESLRRQGPEGEAVARRMQADATYRRRLDEIKKANFLSTEQREAYRRSAEGFRRQSVGFGFEDAIADLNQRADRARDSLRVREIEPGGGGTRFGRSGLFSRAFAGPDEERELRGRATRLQEEANRTLKSIDQKLDRQTTARAG